MPVNPNFTAEDYAKSKENIDMYAKDFNNYLETLVGYIEKDALKIFSEVAVELWKNVVNRTPVLTGIAQNNWQLDSRPNNDTKHKDLQAIKRQTPIADLDVMIGNPVTSGDIPPIPEDLHRTFVLYLFNNLEYIEDLELGLSTKGDHMLSNTLADAMVVFDRIAKKYGYV